MSNNQTVHPGAILRSQFMEQHGLSASGLAIRLHVPAPRVNDIVRERRGISPDSALRLARFFGTTPNTGWTCRTAHDLKVVENLAGEQIRREVAPCKTTRSPPWPPNVKHKQLTFSCCYWKATQQSCAACGRSCPPGWPANAQWRASQCASADPPARGKTDWPCLAASTRHAAVYR